MQRFVVEQSDTEVYTSHAGLALLGHCIRLSLLTEKVDGLPLRHGISHGDVVKTYLGQLCLGKSDFEAAENARNDDFFHQALDIDRVPSSARMRQRMDERADDLLPLVDVANITFLKAANAPVTPLWTGHVALDFDVFPMDNSGTKREGVSWTYKGHHGYAPMGVYLGSVEGWCLACELREGSWHSQKEFLYTLERVVPRARILTELPLLARLDSAHDALENRVWFAEEGVDFLIKWNPRKQDKEGWLAYAEQAEHEVDWSTPRAGKRVAVFSVHEEQVDDEGKTHAFRRVMRVTERTIDKRGQKLLLPDIEIDGWWTSLDLTDGDIIQLYKDHANCEQFHSEFKTDLDLERLPSGKLATNDLVMALGTLAYNMLRYMGLEGLIGEKTPIRHPAKRRRIRTVMQELMYLAARWVKHARRFYLRFSSHCPGFHAFHKVHERLAYA